MKVLLVLCMAAVMLTGEIFAYTYRGQAVGDMMQLPYKPDKPGFCKPGSCVVEYGRLCFCDDFGVAVCPVFSMFDSPNPFDEMYCNCEPGALLPSVSACGCPKSGKMPLKGCGRSLEPTISEESRSVNRQSDDEIFGLSRDAALRCNYYQCYPTSDGQKCVWIPCPQ